MVSGEMKTREFLHILSDLVRQQLPLGLKEIQIAGPTMNLVKLHYGDSTVHYEVWVQKRIGEVELGLHFEGDPAINHRYLEVLSQRLDTIQSALGTGVQVEEWTKSWTRAHEILPLQPLTDDFLIEVSYKLSRTIQTLEPILRDAARPYGATVAHHLSEAGRGWSRGLR